MENLSVHDVLRFVSEQTHMFKRFPQALPALPPMTARQTRVALT